MKKYLTILMALCTMATSIFAEDLTGFWEAKFGDSKEQVINVMSARGWNIKEDKDDVLKFTKSNGTYGNFELSSSIDFKFYKGQFYDVEFSLKNDGYSVLDILELLSVISEKYECKITTIEKDGKIEDKIIIPTVNNNKINIKHTSKYISYLEFYVHSFYISFIDSKIESEKIAENNRIAAEEKAKRVKLMLEDM